jgi:hypothetical protein
MSTDVGKQALVDQSEQRVEAFGGNVDDQLHMRLRQLSERGWQVAAVTSVASGLVLPVGIAALMQVIFGRRLNAASYPQALAVTVHANVVLTIRDLVAAPVNYLRESLGSPLALGTFVRMVDEGSTMARLVGTIDLFIMWWVIVLAIGTAVLYQRSARTMVLTYIGIYGAAAAVVAVATALSAPSV